MAKAQGSEYDECRRKLARVARSFAVCTGGTVTLEPPKVAQVQRVEMSDAVVRGRVETSLTPCPYCDCGDDGHLRESITTTLNPRTLITEIKITAELPSGLTFETISDRSQPHYWQRYGEGFDELVLHRLDDRGNLTRVSSPEVDGNGSWLPGHVIEEKITWQWTTQITAKAHNLLGVEHKVNPGLQRLDSRFWLHGCEQTSFFGSTMAGGLDVDGGVIRVKRAMDDARMRKELKEIAERPEAEREKAQEALALKLAERPWQIVAIKRLRFTDRLSPRGQDTLGLGRLLNFSSGGLIGDWMLQIIHNYAQGLSAGSTVNAASYETSKSMAQVAPSPKN